MGGVAVSAEGGADAATVQSPRSKVQSRYSAFRIPLRPGSSTGHAFGGRSVFSAGHRPHPPSECKVVGAAGGDEFEPSLAPTGQDKRSPTAVGRDVRLVHRGI